LRAALLAMPEETILWNALATVLAEEGRSEESVVFYEEAIRLSPDFARAYHNLGYAYQHLGRLEDGLANYDKALELAVDPTERREARHSRSICLIGAGKLEEGFKEYEVRNDQRFRAYLHHMIEAPLWQGESLAGKKVLLVGEQGLGDEFMFANIIPDVQKAVGETGKLQIAVDPRLISLFQRSFPKAEVGTYDDKTLIDNDGNKALRLIPFATKENKPDVWAPMGSALQHYRTSLADFRHEAFLVPDPARVTEFRVKLAALPGKKVGLCWRSMMLGAKRAKYFSPIDGWAPVLATPGVSFVNLQYGDCAAELARAAEAHGVTVHTIDGLDLKDDIDGAAALCAALDLVISAPTAAAATAASVGTETWFVTAGRTWPQLGTAEYPWYARTRVFWPEKFGDWAALMPEVSDELEVFALDAERRPLVA
jgi:tetratricopeptide (TPR) repeat protein